MTAVGCYTLDLYCDNVDAPLVSQRPGPGQHLYDEFPAQFFHELGSQCRSAAKRKGWMFAKDGRTFCPRCAPMIRSTGKAAP